MTDRFGALVVGLALTALTGCLAPVECGHVPSSVDMAEACWEAKRAYGEEFPFHSTRECLVESYILSLAASGDFPEECGEVDGDLLGCFAVIDDWPVIAIDDCQPDVLETVRHECKHARIVCEGFDGDPDHVNDCWDGGVAVR